MQRTKIDFIRLWVLLAVVLLAASLLLPWWTFEYRVERNDRDMDPETHSLGLQGGESTHHYRTDIFSSEPRFETEDESPASGSNVGALLLIVMVLAVLGLVLAVAFLASLTMWTACGRRTPPILGTVSVLLVLAAFLLFSLTFTDALKGDTLASAEEEGIRYDDGFMDDSPTKSLQGQDSNVFYHYGGSSRTEWDMEWYLDSGALAAFAGGFLLTIATVQWLLYYAFGTPGKRSDVDRAPERGSHTTTTEKWLSPEVNVSERSKTVPTRSANSPRENR